MSEAWARFCKYARDEAWKVKLPILASNLRVAAALCRAFELGFDLSMSTMYRSLYGEWSPGCGRNAP